MKRAIVTVFALCLVCSVTTGCSQSSRTETRISYDQEGNTENRTTVTETEKTVDEGCGGVLSCTVDAVGTVIALPFKIVGSLITAIF